MREKKPERAKKEVLGHFINFGLFDAEGSHDLYFLVDNMDS